VPAGGPSARKWLTEETPFPLAATVIDWLLTSVALLAALRLMLPEFPVPGGVMVAITPLDRALVENLTLLAGLYFASSLVMSESVISL
jgi:hypothetical protein